MSSILLGRIIKEDVGETWSSAKNWFLRGVAGKARGGQAAQLVATQCTSTHISSQKSSGRGHAALAV